MAPALHDSRERPIQILVHLNLPVPTVQQEFATSLWIIALRSRGAPVTFSRAESQTIGHVLRWARFDARA
jgi:hypothetical protein